MVAANRVAAINPPHRRYGSHTEIQYRPRKPHGFAKPSRILSKKEADTEFQYRPHIVDTDTIADAVFCGRHFRDFYVIISPFCRGVPSDGLRRYGLSILKTQGKSEAQMPLKQGSHAPVTKLPFQ